MPQIREDRSSWIERGRVHIYHLTSSNIWWNNHFHRCNLQSSLLLTMEKQFNIHIYNAKLNTCLTDHSCPLRISLICIDDFSFTLCLSLLETLTPTTTSQHNSHQPLSSLFMQTWNNYTRHQRTYHLLRWYSRTHTHTHDAKWANKR